METRPSELTGETFERLFEQAKIEKLTIKEMKAYRESILDYSDVRHIVEYTRDEEKWKKTFEVVMNSHDAGLPLEEIALITELTVAEVEEIIASHRHLK
jgi:hypothetical protein